MTLPSSSLVTSPDLFYIEKFKNESLSDLRSQIVKDPKLLKLILSNLTFHKSVIVQSPLSLTLKSFRLIPRKEFDSKEVKVFFKTISASGNLRFRASNELYQLFDSALKLVGSRIALKFIELGMNLNVRNKNGRSLLHRAASSGKLNVVQKLIDKGLDVNALDDNHMTPLHLACKKGHIEVVKKLLQKRARLNQQASNKITPLMLACKFGNSSAALSLLEIEGPRKAQIHLKGEFQKTALHYAIENNLVEVVKKLVEKGSNLLDKTSDKETPKVLALLRGNQECAKILPDDPYSLDFVSKKLISHFNSLSGNSQIDGTSIPLEGAYSEIMHEKIRDYFEDYANNVKTGLTCLDELHLFKAFEKASKLISVKDTVESIKKEKVTILPVGWEEHAIDLVFYDQTYFVICNGGEGAPEKKKTIMAYKFDPTRINEDLIVQISSYAETVRSEAQNFFYSLLPTHIAFSDDPTKNRDKICDLLEAASNKMIKNGICTSTSGKIALRASSILLKIAKKQEDDKNLPIDTENMKKMTQDASIFFGIKSQLDYLESGKKPDNKFFDISFINEPLIKSEKKIKKRSSSEFVREAFDDLLVEYMDQCVQPPNKKMAINSKFHA